MKINKTIINVVMFFLAFSAQLFSVNAQPISTHFFGQNAWMPDSIGPVKYYGQLDNKWAEVKASGAKIIRYGGIGADKNMTTNYQYVKMIDKIRAQGMEPVMQVPFYNNRFTAAQAAEIVRYVNITKGRGVKYWIIANEPDNEYGYNTAAQVATYLKAFASAMKAVDPTIKTIGPETAWYNKPIIDGLTTPGGPYDVTGKDAAGRFYIDVISFHMYSFNGSQTRPQVLSDLTAQYRYEWNLNDLNSRIANCNSYHGRSGSMAVKTAVTEANVGFMNPATDNLYGVGAMSFVGGQFWAELLAISMNKSVDWVAPWSVVEGNSTTMNCGYIDYTNGNKKPIYYHYQMMAQHFNGTFIKGTDNQTNVKAFGAKNNLGQTVVMILNQDQSVNHNFTVRLDANTPSGTSSLKVNVNSGLAKEYSGTILKEGTQLLVFDGAGNLVKKVEYNLSTHAASNQAPTVTGGGSTTPAGLVATITPSGPTTFGAGGYVNLQANTGTGYTYVWKKNGVVITGATASVYKATTAGSYVVTVKNASGATATSTAVNVTVSGTITPTITVVGGTSICTGSSTLLKSNTASGMTYQWKKNGVNIAGATSYQITVTSAGSYTVQQTLNGNVAVSAPVAITVGTLTAAITASGSTTLTTGGYVNLNATTGTGYTYQWRKNGVNISGATTYTYRATTAGAYTCYVSKAGACGKVTNTINVTTSGGAFVATITTSGASTNLALGGNVWLKANTGTNIKYQWKKNGYAISGATGASYCASQSGTYTCTETYGLTTVTSNSIVVTVATTLTAKISPGGSTTVPAGGRLTLYANTGNNYVYQWKKDGVSISGATASTYIVTTSGSYQLKITYGTTSAWSAPLYVTVGSGAREDGTVATNSTGSTGYMTAEDVNAQQQGEHMFAPVNDSTVNTLGANGRKSTDAASARSGEGMNKTGAAGRKSSNGAGRAAETTAPVDSTELEKMKRNETGTLSIKAFPNPTDGELTITVTTVNTVQAPVRMELYNALGQVVWTKTPVIENGFMNDVIQLDGSVASGDYFLRIREDQNTEIMKVCVIK